MGKKIAKEWREKKEAFEVPVTQVEVERWTKIKEKNRGGQEWARAMRRRWKTREKDTFIDNDI